MTYRPYQTLSASSVSHDRTNNTGVTITKTTPTRINTSGFLDFINVSNELEVAAVSGVAVTDILTGQSGSITNSGKIEDVTTTADYGDLMFIDKTGAVTNIRPAIGVNGFIAGDWSVIIGVVAKNESNPSLKDLIVSIDIQGEL